MWPKRAPVRSPVSKTPAALLFPPPVLHQRYGLERDIGHGGFARVFRAWDAQTARPVAIKRAHLGSASSDMLLREAEILSGLHHPGLPIFLEYFEEAGRCYLVEEWRSGSAMRGQRFFPLSRVLWIGRHGCEILAYLHGCGVIHGDLTPGNVLLSENGVSLLDFGLARRCGDPAGPRGTPGYASPEQWRTGVSQEAGDVYSLGMLLGCALTDSQPKEVRRAGSFPGLWDDPASIPNELFPLLELLDAMTAVAPEARPTLDEVVYRWASLQTPGDGRLR